MKFGFDWPSGFRTEDVSILWKFTCILAPGQGQTTPREGGGGGKFFS